MSSVESQLLLRNKIYAMYTVADKDEIKKEFYDLECMMWEMKCYLQLARPGHPNILKEFEQQNGCLLLPCKSNLFNFCLRQTQVDEKWTKNTFKQLVSAVKYIHSRGIVHKNISLSTIVLDAHNTPMLTSFSLNGDESAIEPPEIYFNGMYTPECDIFNLGVVLFQLMTNSLPFQSATRSDWWYKKIIKGDYSMYWKAFDKDESYPQDFKDLIQKLFEPDPTRRISIENIEKHSWILN